MTLPEKMQALVLRHDGHSRTVGGLAIDNLGDLVALRRIAVPRPSTGQVLIRVALSPVNPSDVHYIRGEYGVPRTRGTPAGFEGTGSVVAAGDGAQAAALIGRRVSFLASASGAWADYALTDAASCVAIDEGLRAEDAAALLVNPLTAVAMIDLAAEAGASAVVLTAAASQLGRFLIPPARARGIAPIAVLRRPDAKAELLALGATQALVGGAPDFAERLATVLRAEKPRILFDAVGDQTSADIFLAMPTHSRWISYGMLSGRGPRLAHMSQFVFSDKRIEGFWLSRWLHAASPEARASAEAEVQRRFLAGEWRTREGDRVALADALEHLPAALGRPGKVMLVPR